MDRTEAYRRWKARIDADEVDIPDQSGITKKSPVGDPLDGQQATGDGAGSPAGPAPAAPDASAFLDPFTGQVSDIPGFLRYLSESKGGRQQLFGEGLQGSSAYQNAPSSVRSFLGSRFDPLEARYLAQGISEPGRGLGNFADFSRQNAQGLGGGGWRDIFSNLWGQFGGVGSAEDVDALGGPSAAGYDLLRNRGLDIFRQAVQANLNPVLSRAAGNVLGQRFANYGRAEAGAPSNQMEFIRQQLPGWASILGNVPTPAVPIRKYGEPSDFDDLSGANNFGAGADQPVVDTPTVPARTYVEPSDFDDLSGANNFGAGADQREAVEVVRSVSGMEGPRSMRHEVDYDPTSLGLRRRLLLMKTW